MMWLPIVLAAVAVWVAHWFLTCPYSYWKKRGVPSPDPTILFGNVGDSILVKKNLGQIFRDIYNDYQDYLYVGVYSIRQPVLLLRDPELIKDVLVKNFSYFHDNDIQVDEKLDPIMARNPFSLKGQKWKVVRGQVTAAITTGKIKNMYSFMINVSKNMLKYLKIESSKNPTDGQDAKEIAAKYTTDVVASCAFGIDGRSFEDPDAEFRKMGKKLLVPSFWMAIKITLTFIVPSIGRFFRIRWVSDELHKWFYGTLMETIKYREANNIVRNDYLDLMLSLKKKPGVYEFKDIDVVAQAMTFYADGFETSSAAIAFTLYELAANPHVQRKLRDEINRALAKYNNELTYEGIQEMSYLDNVFSESLRKYPPGMFLRKLCTKSCTFPPPKGEGTGHSVTIEEGMSVVIPVYGLHWNPDYFPNPEKFDPDRFTEDVKNTRPNNVFLPFGEGPRQCLGYRFALAQSKVALASIISNYDVSVNSKTIEPIQMDPKNIMAGAVGGIWLDFHERNNST